MTAADPADPRPRVVLRGGVAVVLGGRCGGCGTAVGPPWPRCPTCGGEPVPAEFGPEGTVWSATVVRVPVSGRTPPYGLAYVDLDGGPRVLAHVAGDAGEPLPVGTRVRLVAPAGTDDDLRVEATGEVR